jgi:hypothetical protein
MLKKTMIAALAGATLLASSASFADNRHWGHDTRRVVVVERPVVQHYRHYPQYQHYQYARPAPRVVVVQRPVVVQRQVVVHRPAPVYYQSADAGAGLAILAGAAIGGVIAYHIANGN